MCLFFFSFSVPYPEGEQKPAADKAPGGDAKDGADEKMEGKWNGKHNGVWTQVLILHLAEECYFCLLHHRSIPHTVWKPLLEVKPFLEKK